MTEENGRKLQEFTSHYATPEELADRLLTGSVEMIQYPELFRGIPAKTKHVVQIILDRVRVLQLETRKLETKLNHLLATKNSSDNFHYEEGE